MSKNIGNNEINIKSSENIFNNHNNRGKRSYKILRNEFINSKLNKKNIGRLTEEIKPTKRKIINIYKILKSKESINSDEE